MGIGVRLDQIICDAESTSGYTKRRRRLRRKRFSDEIQLLIAVFDNPSGEMIETYNYVKGDVDSGDIFRPDDLFLRTTDYESTEIKLRLMALEIDGVRQLTKLTDKNYKEWIKYKGGILNFIETSGDRGAAHAGMISPLGLAGLGSVAPDDLIAYDELVVNREQISGTQTIDNITEEPSPFSRSVTSGGTTLDKDGKVVPTVGTSEEPISVSRKLEFSRSVANRLTASMTYKSKEALSQYTFKLTFSI
ncbi:hypothetical protein D9V96_014185 [Zobellia laminariae]|uniref:hypothetical protein n=1 Tax=Zobellia laminariae TaxID=248906 RepID=UPI0012D93A07|nr:hypothetical protein [Zobellia laminariae]